MLLEVRVDELGPLGDRVEEVRDLIVLLLELGKLIRDLPHEGHVTAREALAGGLEGVGGTLSGDVQELLDEGGLIEDAVDDGLPFLVG